MTPMELMVVLLSMFFLLIVAMFYLLKSKYRQINTFKDIFVKQKPIPMHLDIDKLNEFLKQIDDLNIVERLFLLRALLGSSYRAVVKVTDSSITIENSAILDLDEDQSSLENIRDITG